MKRYGPLRGRDDALATSLGTVHRTRVHGASGVVLITGDPGIENPRCCRRCVATQRTCGSESPVASTTIEQASPGAPIAGLLRSGRDALLTAAEYQEINGLTGEPLLLVDRIADHLEWPAAAYRVLIAVDDVHWDADLR